MNLMMDSQPISVARSDLPREIKKERLEDNENKFQSFQSTFLAIDVNKCDSTGHGTSLFLSQNFIANKHVFRKRTLYELLDLSSFSSSSSLYHQN